MNVARGEIIWWDEQDFEDIAHEIVDSEASKDAL